MTTQQLPQGLALDVPFLPDQDYAAFLRERANGLHSMHFGLYGAEGPGGFDARVRHEAHPLEYILELLASLPGPKKYALLNIRFLRPGDYEDAELLSRVVKALTRFLEADVVHGVVFSDFRFLLALSRCSPEAMSALEAVPSVNCHIDSPDKAFAALRYIAATRFKTPEKLILDRSMNRRPEDLQRLGKAARRSHPGLRLELLANEGCLYHCPFKTAHDAQIALDNLDPERCEHAPQKADLNCQDYFYSYPEAIFQSPFIRPEDMGGYAGLADVIKLCGRTQGPAVLQRIIDAYLAGSHRGNLLELLDSLGRLAGRIHVANEDLPPGFFAQTSACGHDCAGCGYCAGLAASLARRIPARASA